MKAPRLTVIRNESSPKFAAYKEHLKLCETCRDAINEIDLCLTGQICGSTKRASRPSWSLPTG